VKRTQTHKLLESRVAMYNTPEFISNDPISVPHAYSRLQDIEIAGFWTASISWGLRKTISRNARQLMALMDDAPYEFILHHRDQDRKRFLHFVHRTFQPTDTLYFLEFLQQYYTTHTSLEDAFIHPCSGEMRDILIRFHEIFFTHPYAPDRTRKHVSTPVRNAACKRLNMFLRWMVRRDHMGVDFGLWRRLSPAQLMIPLDVHVQRVAEVLQLLSPHSKGWRAVEELTAVLRIFDPGDPVKYDYALFGMGVME
jgi:uncharacterized protein (TIGR02757 family)